MFAVPPQPGCRCSGTTGLEAFRERSLDKRHDVLVEQVRFAVVVSIAIHLVTGTVVYAQRRDFDERTIGRRFAKRNDTQGHHRRFNANAIRVCGPVPGVDTVVAVVAVGINQRAGRQVALTQWIGKRRLKGKSGDQKT